MLQRGMKNDDVKNLQKGLNLAVCPGPGLVVDGDFGAGTLEVVLRFQNSVGLAPEGVVKPDTLDAIENSCREIDRKTGWMRWAIGELGVAEDSDRGEDNARIIEYHQTCTLRATEDEVPWCAAYVNWVVLRSGLSGTDSAAAASWLKWGQPLTEPRFGAVTIIKSRSAAGNAATGSSSGFHVGFLDSATPTHIRLIGGNQGNRVKYSSFALSGYELKGFRWPG